MIFVNLVHQKCPQMLRFNLFSMLYFFQDLHPKILQDSIPLISFTFDSAKILFSNWGFLTFFKKLRFPRNRLTKNLFIKFLGLKINKSRFNLAFVAPYLHQTLHLVQDSRRKQICIITRVLIVKLLSFSNAIPSQSIMHVIN